MKRVLIASVTTITLLIIASCGGRQDSVSSPVPATETGVRALLASGARLDSAHLLLQVRQPGGEQIVVHPPDQPWLESAVTWNAVGPWVSPFVIATFAAVDTGQIKVNVTTLVNGWLVGTRPNNGILLDQNPPYIQRTRFASREQGALCPKLKLYLSDADSTMIWTLRTKGDAFVDENHPDANMGWDSALYSGYEAGMPGECRAMMNFDLNAPAALAAVGDRVWEDRNADGLQGGSEAGVPNVTVILFDCFDTPVATTLTDTDGMYLFDSLAAGAYRVEVELPAGYSFSPKGAGTDPFLDSDIDPATGSTDCFGEVEGLDDLQWDAGLVPAAPAEPGCTRGPGYWRNHTGSGMQADMVSIHLPIWLGSAGGDKSILVADADVARKVFQMFDYGHPSNGITKLYVQLFAARLNLASGAHAPEIQDVATEADTYLAGADWQNWANLDKETRLVIAGWRALLGQYNAGKLGPGACNDDGDE